MAGDVEKYCWWDAYTSIFINRSHLVNISGATVEDAFVIDKLERSIATTNSVAILGKRILAAAWSCSI